jgi:rubrerythrin
MKSWPGRIWRCSACKFAAYLRWEYSLRVCPSCAAEDTFKVVT